MSILYNESLTVKDVDNPSQWLLPDSLTEHQRNQYQMAIQNFTRKLRSRSLNPLINHIDAVYSKYNATSGNKDIPLSRWDTFP